MSRGFGSGTLIHMYVKCGCLEHARQMFDVMTDINEITWTYLLVADAKSGEMEAASDSFGPIPKKDMVALTSMATIYVQNERLKEALKLFEEMQNAWVKTDVVELVRAISACTQLCATRYVNWIRDAAEKLFALDQLITEHYVQLSNLYSSVHSWNHVAGFLLMKVKFLSKDFGHSSLDISGKFKATRVGDRTYPTLWYRTSEVLLSATHYSNAVKQLHHIIMVLGDECCCGNKFHIFESPRLSEFADLEDKVDLKGGGNVTIWTIKRFRGVVYNLIKLSCIKEPMVAVEQASNELKKFLLKP